MPIFTFLGKEAMPANIIPVIKGAVSLLGTPPVINIKLLIV